MAANNLDNTKAEVFSTMVQKELLDSMTIAPLIEDVSEMAIEGVNVVSVPKLSSFTTAERAFGAAGVDNTPLTDSVDQIPLSQNPIVKWNYDAADAMQSSINYQLKAAERAASAHVRNSNSKLIAGMIAASNFSAGLAGGDITEDAILAMRAHLLKNEGDINLMTLLIPVDQETAMLKIPNFIRSDYRGLGAPIVTGQIGTVYGVKVVITNSSALPSDQAIMVEKTGYAYAVQRQAKYAEQPNLDYGTDGVKAVVDTTWGHGPLQVEEGLVPVAGQSALIATMK